jgi:hypothetical protein
MSQQKVDSGTHCEVQEEPGIDREEVVLQGIREKGKKNEVNDVAEQDCQKHFHPVVNDHRPHFVMPSYHDKNDSVLTRSQRC